jgi:hypothetical protein
MFLSSILIRESLLAPIVGLLTVDHTRELCYTDVNKNRCS